MADPQPDGEPTDAPTDAEIPGFLLRFDGVLTEAEVDALKARFESSRTRPGWRLPPTSPPPGMARRLWRKLPWGTAG